MVRPALLVLLCSAVLLADGIPKSEFKTRRVNLRKSLDGVMVLFGADEPQDLHNPFFQDTNFLYLSGWKEPGAVMILTSQEEMIFLPPRKLQEENFTGRKTLADDQDATEKTGFEKVLPRAAIEASFLRL